VVAPFLLTIATACDSKVEIPANLSSGTDNAAQAKREAILAEIKTLGDHEWAGEYYSGDGLGVNISLEIAPGSGYLFEWHGCLGLYDRNYGPVAETDNLIHLSFTFENKRKGFRGIAPDFVAVAWGARRYLIPADDLIGFCNNVNEGREPRMGRYGFYLLRRGDEEKEVAGFPHVPDEFRSYLLDEPIEATITAIGAFTTRPSVCEWNFKDTPVSLDAGSNKGLRPGMELVVIEPSHTVESVRLTSVEADRSEGVMTQTDDEKGPKAGWRLSTQAPRHRPTQN
jgi:hypothetical protein